MRIYRQLALTFNRGRLRTFSYLAVVAISCQVAAGDGGMASVRHEAVDDWRMGLGCGPNALYLYMRAHGWSGTLEEVYEAVPVKAPHGATFLSVVEAANRFGIESRLVRAPIASLGYQGWPVIVHQETADSDGNLYGHFLIVTGISESANKRTGIDTIDPLTLVEQHITFEEFQRCSSGVALVRQRKKGFIAGVFSGSVISIVNIILGTWLCVALKKKFSALRFSEHS